MFFSIIVPAYNAAESIKRCINSIKKQSFREFEMIVVNDGSSDATEEVLREEESLLFLKVIHTKNNGVSSARNTGLSHAEGDYVIFLDSDDEMTEDSLSVYYNILKERPSLDIVIGDFWKKYPSKEKLCHIYKDCSETAVYSEGKKEFNPYISRTMGTVWGKCYRRVLFEGCTFDKELSLCEDAELNCRIFPKAKEIAYIPKPVYRYYYGDSSTIRKYDPNQIKKYEMALEILLKYRNGVLTGFVNEFICNVYNVICVNVICNENNPANSGQKIREIKETTEMPVFFETFTEADLRNVPLKHRFLVKMAQKKNYKAIYRISSLYNKK